jgi:hypothetical protein
VSDIIGSGYGSVHDWRRDLTDFFGGERGTRYVCRHGDALFVHLYDLVPDIFRCMELCGVTEHCVGES